MILKNNIDFLTFNDGLAKIYETATIITFDGMYYRHDIGLR